MKVYKFTMDFNNWGSITEDLTEGKEYFAIGENFKDDVDDTRDFMYWQGDKTELIEKPKEELKDIYFECTSEEQLNHYKPFMEDNFDDDWKTGFKFISCTTKEYHHRAFAFDEHSSLTEVTEQEFAEEMKRRGLDWEIYNPTPEPFIWNDDKVIDFVNWYIKLHKLLER